MGQVNFPPCGVRKKAGQDHSIYWKDRTTHMGEEQVKMKRQARSSFCPGGVLTCKKEAIFV